MIKDGVVLDTSVLLNLLGSGRSEDILSAVGVQRIVVEVTSREVLRHPLAPDAKGDPLESLVGRGLLQRMPLSPKAYARFIELTGAEPPDDLDDGEAASLAAGEELGFAVAIDERKGRRIARERLPKLEVLSSVDVFRLAEVVVALGDGLVDAVFSALVHARMRVLPQDDPWVRSLLGPDRVARCPSLRQRKQ